MQFSLFWYSKAKNMGKKDKKGDTSASSEEEYVVEKVLDRRTVRGKVGGQIFAFLYFSDAAWNFVRFVHFLFALFDYSRTVEII